MIRRRFLLALTACLLAVAAPARADTQPADAKAFIESLAHRAIASLTDNKVAREERVNRFRSLFRDHFAAKGIGKFVLGRYWKTATEAERDEYQKLFEDLMVVSYVDRFAEYAGENLEVVKSLPDSDSLSTVYSEIRRPGASQPIRIDWRVAKTSDGAFKIVDVVVEGTSMSRTLRSDFSSIIRQHGGEVAGLLQALREKTASLKSAEAPAN